MFSKVAILLVVVFAVFTLQNGANCNDGASSNTVLEIGSGSSDRCRDKNTCRQRCRNLVPGCRVNTAFEISFTNNMEEAQAYKDVCLSRMLARVKDVKMKAESFFSRTIKRHLLKIDPTLQIDENKELSYTFLKEFLKTVKSPQKDVLTGIITHARLLRTFSVLCVSKPNWKDTLKQKLDELSNYNNVTAPTGPSPLNVPIDRIAKTIIERIERRKANPHTNPWQHQVNRMRFSLSNFVKGTLEKDSKKLALFVKNRDSYSRAFYKYMKEGRGRGQAKQDACKCSQFGDWIANRKKQLLAKNAHRQKSIVGWYVQTMYPNVPLKKLPDEVFDKAYSLFKAQFDEFEQMHIAKRQGMLSWCQTRCSATVAIPKTPSSGSDHGIKVETELSVISGKIPTTPIVEDQAPQQPKEEPLVDVPAPQREFQRISKTVRHITVKIHQERTRQRNCCSRKLESNCCQKPLTHDCTGEKFSSLVRRLARRTRRLMRTIEHRGNQRRLHRRTRKLLRRVFKLGRSF